MALIRQWLVGVTCAALLAAVADGLMPNGPIKQIGKLVCGLVLLCVVLRPLMSPELARSVEHFGQLGEAATEQRKKLDEQSNAMLKASIERECNAYIVDKAAQLGAVCQVQTECVWGEGGMWLPAAVRIVGQLEVGQRQALTQTIEKELGIDAQHQTYSGGG